MSRAINVRETVANVRAKCESQRVDVSAIEALASGGTRVVLSHPDAADTMRQIFARKIIEGKVRRVPLTTLTR